MRTGTIIAFNTKVRTGIIKDVNAQKLRFYLEDDRKIFKRFEVVKFNISFVNGGLHAVNIIHVLDEKGKPVSLKIDSK